MKMENILNSTIGTAIILLLLSTFVQNYYMKLLINLFLMTIIIFWLTKDLNKSFIISFLLTIIYYLSNDYRPPFTLEGFEDNDDNKDDNKEDNNTDEKDNKEEEKTDTEVEKKDTDDKEDIKVEDLVKELKQLNDLANKDLDDVDDTDKNEMDELKEEDIDIIDEKEDEDDNVLEVEEKEEETVKENMNIKRKSKRKNKNELPTLDDNYMKKMTPARAQRETFRLIDTMRMLKDTMEGMGPSLEEGAKIMEKFKKLNLIDIK